MTIHEDTMEVVDALEDVAPMMDTISWVSYMLDNGWSKEDAVAELEGRAEHGYLFDLATGALYGKPIEVPKPTAKVKKDNGGSTETAPE